MLLSGTNMKNKSDLFFELILGFFMLLLMSIMIFLLFFFFLLPVTNYYHTDGFIEYKNQHVLSAEAEGVITETLVLNDSLVKKGTPLLRYHSEENKKKIQTLTARLHTLESEKRVKILLLKSGAIDKVQLIKKQLEIDEVTILLKQLSRNLIKAPIDGRVHFNILPQYMAGTFIKYGQELAFIYKNRSKHIRLVFPNRLNDRFPVGTTVIFQYKDPGSFRVKKMKGKVYKRFLDTDEHQVELYCEVTKGIEQLQLLRSSTVVNASVVINNTSIAFDLFRIDLTPMWLISLKSDMDSWLNKYLPYIAEQFDLSEEE